METPLCKLAYKYGTDKCPQLFHDYTPFYYNLLKDKDIKKVLEIGIGNERMMKNTPTHYRSGGSLRMWRDFFPKAQIYGVDYDPETMFSEERIETFLLNSKDIHAVKELINKIGSDVDLVIDDGNHQLSAQTRTALNFLPLLDNPIYIIEDVSQPRKLGKMIGYNFKSVRFPVKSYKACNLLMIWK